MSEYPRYDDLLKIDQALTEYGSVHTARQGGMHDLTLLHFAQGFVDEPENDGYTEAEIFTALAENVSLHDDERWAEASWQHERDKCSDFLRERGILIDPPEEYMLHFGIVGYTELLEPDRARLAHALAPHGRLYQDGDRFAEWGERGLLDLHEVRRVADIAGHFMVRVETPGFHIDAGTIWSTIQRTLTGYLFLTPEQIAETGGPTPDYPYVTSTVQDWSALILA